MKAVKKNIVIALIAAAVFVIGGVTVAVVLNNGSAVTVSASDMLQLADRYLKELNYEQAVIEFQKVLEIEPKSVEAYMGLAEAYIALGEKDGAVQVLREGFEVTGDLGIQDMLDRISGGSAAESDEAMTTTATIETEPVFGSMGTVTVSGTELDIATTKKLYIFNKELYEQHQGAGDYNSWNAAIIYLKDDLSKSDFENLHKLSELRSLSIMFAGITDITPLTGLINLESLSLFYNQITDITPLTGLTNLTRLELTYNQIVDITPLAGLTNLTYLCLGFNQIIDITPLMGLTNLTFLGLDSNQIINITPLTGLTNLTHLYLGSNQISDITPLTVLTNLIDLTLWDNQIADITPLTGLTNLAYLYLGSNQISDITPLAQLTNLTSLSLYYNQITDITPLIGLTNLTYLYLSGNPISEVDFDTIKTRLPNCEIV